ncbi:MAG: hypothetical protein ACREOY_14290 [Candidatus Dormibacteraceae bacterium]
MVFGIVAGLAATGRLGDLRYANIPLIHPWPPAGYYQNPYDPTDRGDIINAADAAKVKAALLADGQIELDALRSGNESGLTLSTTGQALQRLQLLIRQNNTAGIFEDETINLKSVSVGRLADPNLAAAVTWCVEEKGVGTIKYSRRSDGSLVRTVVVTFDNRFWLVLSGGRYLITDSQVSGSTSS